MAAPSTGRARVLAFLLAGFAVVGTAFAYPDKPIRFVVPFAPGGGTDLIARTLKTLPMVSKVDRTGLLDERV